MNQGLQRSTQDVKLAGVCAGVAHYFNQPATNIRVLWFLVTLFSMGLGIVAYIGMALILPQSETF